MFPRTDSENAFSPASTVVYGRDCTLANCMLEKKFPRSAVFFSVAFGVPVPLTLLTGGNFNRGVQIGIVMGIIFAVMSQFFEPTER